MPRQGIIGNEWRRLQAGTLSNSTLLKFLTGDIGLAYPDHEFGARESLLGDREDQQPQRQCALEAPLLCLLALVTPARHGYWCTSLR